MSDPVGNPEVRSSRVAAQFIRNVFFLFCVFLFIKGGGGDVDTCLFYQPNECGLRCFGMFSCVFVLTCTLTIFISFFLW